VRRAAIPWTVPGRAGPAAAVRPGGGPGPGGTALTGFGLDRITEISDLCLVADPLEGKQRSLVFFIELWLGLL
jgi:hypothetical protein